jgi:hypothetical protein
MKLPVLTCLKIFVSKQHRNRACSDVIQHEQLTYRPWSVWKFQISGYYQQKACEITINSYYMFITCQNYNMSYFDCSSLYFLIVRIWYLWVEGLLLSAVKCFICDMYWVYYNINDEDKFHINRACSDVIQHEQLTYRPWSVWKFQISGYYQQKACEITIDSYYMFITCMCTLSFSSTFIFIDVLPYMSNISMLFTVVRSFQSFP